MEYLVGQSGHTAHIGGHTAHINSELSRMMNVSYHTMSNVNVINNTDETHTMRTQIYKLERDKLALADRVQYLEQKYFAVDRDAVLQNKISHLEQNNNVLARNIHGLIQEQKRDSETFAQKYKNLKEESEQGVVDLAKKTSEADTAMDLVDKLAKSIIKSDIAHKTKLWDDSVMYEKQLEILNAKHAAQETEKIEKIKWYKLEISQMQQVLVQLQQQIAQVSQVSRVSHLHHMQQAQQAQQAQVQQAPLTAHVQRYGVYPQYEQYLQIQPPYIDNKHQQRYTHVNKPGTGKHFVPNKIHASTAPITATAAFVKNTAPITNTAPVKNTASTHSHKSTHSDKSNRSIKSTTPLKSTAPVFVLPVKTAPALEEAINIHRTNQIIQAAHKHSEQQRSYKQYAEQRLIEKANTLERVARELNL